MAKAFKIAGMDGWLFTRCVVPFGKVSAFAIKVVKVIDDIEGRTVRATAFEHAVGHCGRRAAAFARAAKEGAYGQGALPYADEWDRYAQGFAALIAEPK